MAEYPIAVYSPRTKANRSGVVYDPTKTKQIFAEDVTKLDDEVVAIENILGTDPQGAFATVKAWLEDLASATSLARKFNMMPLVSTAFSYISASSTFFAGVYGQIRTSAVLNNIAVIGCWGGTLGVTGSLFLPRGICGRIKFQNFSNLSASFGLGGSVLLGYGEGVYFKFVNGNLYATIYYFDIDTEEYIETTELIVSPFSNSITDFSIIYNDDTDEFDFYVDNVLSTSLGNTISGEDISFAYTLVIKTLTTATRNIQIANFGLMPF